MPDWVHYFFDLVSMSGFVAVILWAYRVGKKVGEVSTKMDNIVEKQEAMKKEVDTLKSVVVDCPLRECTELFRKMSSDIAGLNASMNILLKNITK